MSSIRKAIRNVVLTDEDKHAIEVVKKVNLLKKWVGSPVESFPATVIKGYGPKFVYMPGYGHKRTTNDHELRGLAKTPTPAACIRRLINDVVSTEWQIIASDPKKQKDTKVKEHIDHITLRIRNPNKNQQSFRQIQTSFLEDLLILDAGVLVKSYATLPPHQMTQLYARDGSSFLKEIDEFGNFGKFYEGKHSFSIMVDRDDKKTPEYRTIEDKRIGYWQHATMRRMPVPFEPYEIIYTSLYPNTYEVYGMSNIQILQLRLKTLMASDIAMEQYFRRGEIGKSLFSADVELGMDDNTWKRFKGRLDAEIKNESSPIITTDQKGSVTSLQLKRRDIQWLEQQKEYRLSILALFNVTPIMLGWTEDVPKATEQTQREIYLRKGLWPLLKLFEYKMNMEYITEFFRNDEDHSGKYAGEPMDVVFSYDLYDPLEEQHWLERSEVAAKSGIKTINEMRAERRMEPVSWGDYNPAAVLAIQQFAQGHFMAPDVITAKVFSDLTGIPIQDVDKVLGEFPKPTEEPEKKREESASEKWENYKESKTD